MSLSTVLQRIFGILLLAAGVVLAQVPTITSFTPLSATAGSSVTITGTNFSATASSNIVRFGSVTGVVTAASTTSLSVTVPSSALHAQITVTVNGYTVYSKYPFSPKSSTTSTVTTGTFYQTGTHTLTTVSNKMQPNIVRIGDIDGDGKSDLIVSGSAYMSDSVSVLRNLGGSGMLDSIYFAPKVGFRVGTNSSNILKDIELADFDNDGKLDIAVYEDYTGLHVMRNQSTSGSISFASPVLLASHSTHQKIGIADVDGDGKVDIISASFGYGVYIHRNTSSGAGNISFASNVFFATGNGNSQPTGVSFADLNTDGKPDMVVSNQYNQSISVFRNTSTPGSITSGSFAAKVDYSVGSRPSRVITGDVDGDGKIDVIATAGDYWDPRHVAIFRNTTSSDSITLASSVNIGTLYYGATEPMLRDFTGDNKPDLYLTTSEGYHEAIVNTSTSGTISFDSPVYFSNTSGVATGIADFDNDGHADIIVPNYNSGDPKIKLMRNNTGPRYSIDKTTAFFGYVANGTTKQDSITVTNLGGTTLTISSISSNNVKLTVSPASATIAAGGSQKVYLTFAPQSGSDTTATVTITHNATGSPNTVTARHVTLASFSAAAGPGNALTFDYGGYSDYVSIPYNSAFSSNVITMEAWVKITSSTYSGAVISNGTSIYNGIHIYPSYTGGWTAGVGNNSNVYEVNDYTQRQQNVWTHLAVTYRNDSIKLYVNGVLKSTGVYSMAVNPSSPLRLGSITDHYDPWYNGFEGQIDEVRIWNVARTEEQIIKDMNRSSTGLETGLVGYWRFDEGSGTTSIDKTMNARDVVFPSNADNQPSWGSSSAGFPAPWFRKSLTDMNFGSVQTNRTHRDSFYIRNIGGSSLSITNISSSGSGFSVSPTSATVAPDDSAKFFVSFLPTANGAHSATLTISHNATGSTAYHYLSGTGATASYSVNSSTRALGSVQLGVSKTDSFTVSNSGSIALTIDSVRSSLSSYTVTPTSASVPASGSQKFYVTFASASPTGSANGTISLYHSVSGSPGIVNVTGTKVQQVAASAGTALTFDGTNDYVTRALVTTATNNISFDAWVKWDGQGASGNKYIFYNGHTGSSGYGLFIEGSSSPNNSLTILCGGVGYARSTYVLTAGQWQHISVVRDAGVWKLYVDGVQQCLTNTSVSPNTPAGATYIGSNINGIEAFKGSIDEVRIWNVARSQAQNQASYNSLVGNESGLLAYYRFDENYGSIAYDNSGNNRNGTMTNGPAFASSTAPVGTPVYSVSPSSLAFGSVQAGLVKTDSITVSNTGSGVLNIGTITSGNAAYTISPSNVAVRSGSSQKFYITFLAPAPAAAQNTSLSVPHNASGSPSSVSVTGASVFQAVSNAGNGLTFTGTSKFVDIPAHAALSSQSFTVEMWLKIGATWGWSGVIDKGRNTGNNWFILTTNSGVGQAQGVTFGMQGGVELVNIWGDNGWHHIAATFDGSTQRLYVDGVLSGGYAGVTYTPTNDLIRIGGRQDTSVYSLNPFIGNIDEVRFWNVARTQSEIQQSYSSRAGNETGLVSYLRFDESSGATAYDATGNGRNGTLVNGLSRMIPSTAPVGIPVFSAVSSKDIGKIYLSKSRMDSVTITNSGNGILNISSITSDNAQFTVSPSTLNITGGNSAKLYITALPTSLGLKSGSITLTHNGSGSPSAISVTATSVVPVISSFSPSSGPVGTSVVISGSGFSSTPANNTVFFGASKGTVTASSETTITVTVPAGVTYHPITVNAGNFQAHSRNGFIVTFTTSNSVTSGSFAAKQSVSAPTSGYGLTFSDIDGDGKPDAVLGVESANGLSILRNTGSSGTVSFAAASNFATSTDGLEVKTGDLDGDGKPDVVVVRPTAGFSIFRNTSSAGTISFAARIDSALNYAHDAAIGDLDGDGKPELVVVDNGYAAVKVYRNASVPGTITLTSVLSASTGNQPREVHLIDLDGDGRLDITTSNFSDGTISVLRNTSSIGSVSFAAKLDLTGASGTFGMALGDLNGDGKPEVVSGSSSNVVIYQNNSSSGTLSFSSAVSISASANRTVTIADISGDGKPDIASINSSGTVSVLKNIHSSGSLSASSFLKTDFSTASAPWDLRSADVDGDGKIDLIAIHQTGSTMSVLRNTVPLPATIIPNPSGIAFGNVNLGSNKSDSTWVKNTGGVTLSISAAVTTNAQYAVSPSSATVAVGDSVKFTVTFTPTQVFSVNAKLVFTSNTAAASDTVSLSGSGTGPVLSLSAVSKSYGSVFVSSNKLDSIYLKNTGNTVLSVTNVLSDNAKFGVQATSFSINALDSAKLIITFTPSSSGSTSATIQIMHNGQSSPTSLAVDGRGIQPVFTPSAASIAFGNTGFYQSKTDSLTVTNSGVDTLIIASAAKANAAYTVTPTTATIAPSGSQKFYVSFNPVTVTSINDTLSFTHNAGAVTKIPLSGTGALQPASAAGSALDLNGSGQYADLADGVWFNGNFTVETWVYIRAVANYTRIIDFANGQSSNNIIITASEGTSGKIGFHIFNGAASTNITTPNAVPLNTWVHVACVFNSGTGKIYLNGIEAVSGTLNTPVNVTRTLNYIGRSQWADPYVNMRMDEFRIWNVARTSTQIQSTMNSSLAGNESGLLAYLRFDESSGSTAVNFTAAGTNAAMLGGASRAVSSAPLPGANLIASKSAFAYGTATIGASTPDTIWVKNLGGISLVIDSVKSSNSEFTVLPASATIVTGDSLRFIATLTPVTSGAKSGTITFYSNAFSTPNNFTASGTAFSAEPTVRDSNAVAVTLLPYSVTVKWKEGDGENHLVLIKASGAVDGTPSDGTTYSANASFGSGAQLGTGNFALYAGADDSVVITNLTAGTTYYVSVIGYNGTGVAANYLLPSAATASFTLPYAVNSPLPGNALLFDGTGSKSMTVMSASPTAYTVEMWIKLNSTGNQSIFARTDAGGPMFSYSHALDIFGGYIRHYIYDGSPKSVTDVTPVAANTWYHVAIVAVNGGTMRLYVNGTEVGTPVSVGTLWSGGDRYLAGFGWAGQFDGAMDELRIWGGERTAQQIRESMHRRIGGALPGLLSYFQFNESAGNAADSVNGSIGILSNAPARQASTVPFGSGTAVSVLSAQTGTLPLGAITLQMTDGFDNPADITATAIETAPNQFPSGYSSIIGNRYIIVSAFGSTGAFTATLSFELGAGAVDSRADLFPEGVKLFRRNAQGDGTWTYIGSAATANSAAGSITWTGISQLGQYAAVYEESALPVELVSFTASSQRLNAELKWSTATESGNYGFTVQRASVNGSTTGSDSIRAAKDRSVWTDVGFLEGSGTTNAPQEYSFADRNLKAGRYQYRLKQVDNDGRFGYSKTVEVTVGAAPLVFGLSQNYPNPFNPATVIEFSVPATARATLKVYNLVGQEVATIFDGIAEAGTYHAARFDASQLASGIYLARLVSDNKTQIKKMVLMK